MSASGRVCEITNGRFVEAKHEKRWLAVRLLRSKPAGRFGSIAGARGRRSTVCSTTHTGSKRPVDRQTLMKRAQMQRHLNDLQAEGPVTPDVQAGHGRSGRVTGVDYCTTRLLQ